MAEQMVSGPSEALADQLAAHNLSAHRLAANIEVAPEHIVGVINGKRTITPTLALRLGTYFGSPATYWMGLQVKHTQALLDRELMRLKTPTRVVATSSLPRIRTANG